MTRTFDISGTHINGAPVNLHRIDFTVSLGVTEIWAVTNYAAAVYNFHVHGGLFHLLDIDANIPPPPTSGWKDTINLRPFSTVRMAMRFDYADRHHTYMYRCHRMYHKDQGMMSQFLVQ